ncbi:MAG: helix-turn-helix transcriptional regulator [Firmicutes bacterium]|nr:helix-turn-helix transcriptional regulator [Bacillota bacterium]
MDKIILRIKELREEKELTQMQLAKELGFSRNTISQYERGEREPDFQTLKKLCDFFEVTSDYLLGFEDL